MSASISERPQRWDASFDPEMTEAMVDRLLTIPPFNKMDPANFPRRLPLREILKHDTRIRHVRRGEMIVRQGDYGTSAFLILSGEVRVVLRPPLSPAVLGRREPARRSVFRILAQVFSSRREPESFNPSELQRAAAGAMQNDKEAVVFLQDIPRLLDEHETAVMGAGEFFGEISALSRMPRTATIFSDSEIAELLDIRWQGLRDLMRYDTQLQKQIDDHYRKNALASHFRTLPMFRHLSAEAQLKVMEQTEFATYGDYEWSGDYKRSMASGQETSPRNEPLIAQEGDYPNGIVLVRSGFARVSRKFGAGHRTLNYLGAGQHYGFEEIAHNWRKPNDPVPLQNSLRVLGYSHLLIIPTAVMEQWVLPTIPAPDLPPLIECAPATEEDPAPARLGADLVEFVTENRFFNGTAAMVIDLDRCTRCDDCVRACAVTHDNNPRFLRHGPTAGRIMVANACMHCIDPVCMIGCPTGAIHRDLFGGEVVINPATCIGCRVCANNCPYDAIRMVEIRNEAGQGLLDLVMRPILKATKCDLCVEQLGGPACQRACPHGALTRMDTSDLKSFERWLER